VNPQATDDSGHPPLFDVLGEVVPDEESAWNQDAVQRPAEAAPQCRARVCTSPDGKTVAFIRDYNIWLRPAADADAPAIRLSTDGDSVHFFSLDEPWSPDSRKIAAYRMTRGTSRVVRYVISSPAKQLQPDYMGRNYPKPGDEVTRREPRLFDVAALHETRVDTTLFTNAYNLIDMEWRADSRAFTFEYNRRGHQLYRVMEVNAETGAPRILISEEPKTFFSYTSTSDVLSSGGGGRYRYDVNDGREMIWLSERDGWKHLYLYDGVTGGVKNQITKGEYVVRAVQRVDPKTRRIWFTAGGMNRGQDPYFKHYYRINFDGTGLVALTSENGTHTMTWSPDSNSYYVDTWSAPDAAPVTVLKRGSDQKIVMELERGDMGPLVAAGWTVPEPFVAKGRDGVTDIWGVVIKPSNFDPSKKYPVIESIYAGPQGSFVPKEFSTRAPQHALAEHGFIVVQIDGMGTANRSKAFHDVAYKNLGDAGFPDRILWHKAFAARNPWYDIERVGIYGTSAGGQNAMGALLFHPEFYKVAFSAAGCHDNRMDKMWWNEQWMSWPIGPEYVASSNMENAAKLQGKLMLYVGELDTNVDPSSTLQVVNALIRANKTFEFILQPNADHGSGGAYGLHKMTDFFVHNLLGVEPPSWTGQGG
jgi:dipeptidyl aminopeptidase/acylaminoacyl peptidase